jgi:hypothetical protein
MIVRRQPDNLSALADQDLGSKRQAASQLGPELRPRDRLSDHEGAGRTDVYDIEMLQLCGQGTWSEGPVTSDVHPSQKYHECHW